MVQIIVSQPSLWVWLAPALTFCGSLVLFAASMLTVWRTNKAALGRQVKELEAKAIEAKADRSAARADQLRVEVAAILAERPTTLDSQRALFDAAVQHRMELESNVSPADRVGKVLTVRQLHIEHSDKLEQLVIRALLLTTDPSIDAALTEVRDIAHNWNLPLQAAQSQVNDIAEFAALGTRLTAALDELEAATRKLTAVESDSASTK